MGRSLVSALEHITEVGGGQTASPLPQVGPPSTPNIVLGAPKFLIEGSEWNLKPLRLKI